MANKSGASSHLNLQVTSPPCRPPHNLSAAPLQEAIRSSGTILVIQDAFHGAALDKHLTICYNKGVDEIGE